MLQQGAQWSSHMLAAELTQGKSLNLYKSNYFLAYSTVLTSWKMIAGLEGISLWRSIMYHITAEKSYICILGK